MRSLSAHRVRSRARLSLLASAALLMAGALLARADELPEERVVPLAVFVAKAAEGPAVSEAFVSEQIEWANRLFRPFSIRFVPARTEALGAKHGRLETRSDRDALAEHVRDGAIDVFFVERLRDVDEPERFRMGVHWRHRPDRAIRYVVVSSIAVPDVLAHELGHYFGNRHSKVTDNIMSYDRSGETAPFFDARQGRRIERSLSRSLERGELRLVKEAQR